MVVEVLFAGPALAVLAGQAIARGRARPFVAAGAFTAALSTLLACWLWYRQGSPNHASAWPLVGTAALTVHAVLVCRWAPRRAAAAASSVTILAESVLILPITGPAVANWRAGTAACIFWSLAGLAGGCFGLYLRQLDTGRVRAVRQARQEQRVQLATDLHDFVAHDVSAIVVQVQAARILLPNDADEVARVLGRIEADGVRALSAMDRTVRLLRKLEEAADDPPTDMPDATELPVLVRRFARSWDGPVSLDGEPRLASELSAPAGAAVYRVAVEALTNVRRHARRGAAVEVHLRRHRGGVALSVTDESGADTPASPVPLGPRRRAGSGLAGLAERINLLGGTLAYGPTGTAGWRLRAELPATALRKPA